ncbi:MAG: tetraacyldisaccharide 4'-kinase [Pseudomonadota bacterium]
MKPPSFWQYPPDAPGFRARLLSPLGDIYGAMTAKRVARAPVFRPPKPVICVGNLNVGGTGKTPMVLALVQHFQTRGLKVGVISRGHGGRLTGPVEVNERQHKAEETGDEPLLISAFARTWIGRNRAAVARAASAADIDVLVMDDGHQNPDIAKDLSITVVDAARGFGNGRCLPAGPLRERVTPGLARSDVLVSIGDPKAQSFFRERWSADVTVPHLTGILRTLETGMDWNEARVLAFAGIGHPEKFFDTLRSLGADLVHAEPLDDHQTFTPALLNRLDNDAKALCAQLVTTEKDAVRLPADFRRQVLTVPVRLHLGSWHVLENLFEKIGLPPTS